MYRRLSIFGQLGPWIYGILHEGCVYLFKKVMKKMKTQAEKHLQDLTGALKKVKKLAQKHRALTKEYDKAQTRVDAKFEGKFSKLERKALKAATQIKDLKARLKSGKLPKDMMVTLPLRSDE